MIKFHERIIYEAYYKYSEITKAHTLKLDPLYAKRDVDEAVVLQSDLYTQFEHGHEC